MSLTNPKKDIVWSDSGKQVHVARPADILTEAALAERDLLWEPELGESDLDMGGTVATR